MRTLQILPFPEKRNIVAITNDCIQVHRSLFRPEEGTIYSVRKIEKAKSTISARKTFRTRAFSHFLDWFELEYGSFSIGQIRTDVGARPRITTYQVELMHDLYISGKSLSEIGEIMNLGYAHVAKYLRVSDWSKWKKQTRILIGDLPDIWGAWSTSAPTAKRRVPPMVRNMSKPSARKAA